MRTARLDAGGYNIDAKALSRLGKVDSHEPLSAETDQRGSRDLRAVPDRSAPEKEEREALDAYSRVIVTVAEALGPAVVNLRAEAREGSRRGRRLGVRIPVHARRLPPHQPSRGPRLGAA